MHENLLFEQGNTSLFSDAAATAVGIALFDVLVVGDRALDPIHGLAEELRHFDRYEWRWRWASTSRSQDWSEHSSDS